MAHNHEQAATGADCNSNDNLLTSEQFAESKRERNPQATATNDFSRIVWEALRAAIKEIGGTCDDTSWERISDKERENCGVFAAHLRSAMEIGLFALIERLTTQRDRCAAACLVAADELADAAVDGYVAQMQNDVLAADHWFGKRNEIEAELRACSSARVESEVP